MNFTCTEIQAQAGLDPITIFWQDWAPGRGAVTITCYGSAWTCYFGAMSDRTIRQFFAEADSDYLVKKLKDAQWQKQTRGHAYYLTRVVDAVKKGLRESAPSRRQAEE